jgi:D-alanine-D-alanine ligase
LVHNLTDLQERCAKVFDEFGGALIEEYIEGREFTVLVAGTRDSIHVFPPVEYNFSGNKTFITFEDKWGENFTDSHWHFLNEEKGPEEQILIDDLMLLAKQLYESFNGDGYARIDIRQDNKTKQLLILDCNPNCSVFYKYSCSADLIMQSGDWSREKFMKFILEQGLERRRQYHLKHACVVKYSLQNGYGTYASRNLLEGDLAYTNEHRSFQLITKKYAEQTLNKNEMICFNNNG